MTLLWPQALFLLIAIPLAIAVYVMRMRPRAPTSELAAFAIQDPKARRHRHIVFLFFMLATAVMVLSLSRPERAFGVPRFEGTVIIAIDTSTSMNAEDAEPTRLEFARSAARKFVEVQPDSINVGVVSFSNNGAVVQPPSDQTEETLAAIDRLEPAGPTSLAQGIYAALEVIVGDPLLGPEDAVGTEIDTTELGFHGDSIILLFSDGEDTSDPDADYTTAMADVSAALGVEVYAVGIGTEAGAVIEVDGFSLATRLIEESLINIAELTGGEYQRAETDNDFAALYDRVDRQFTTEGETTEVTAVVALAGATLLLLAAAFSMRWFGRVP